MKTVKFWEAMKAYEEGKQVRSKAWSRADGWSDWVSKTGPLSDTAINCFRACELDWQIKEEPKEIWAVYAGTSTYFHDRHDEAIRLASSIAGSRIVLFREVIE